MKSSIQLCFVVIAVFLLLQTHLPAGGTVNSPNESSLRTALAGGGSVTFACNGTITLSSPLIVTNATTVDASGHNIVLSGGGTTRLIQVQPGVSLSLLNLNLANGLALGNNGGPAIDGSPGQGGAISINGGTVNALNCSFNQNTAHGGNGGSNTIFNPNPNGNGGPGRGGAVYVNNGSFNATNCGFSMNSSIGGNGSLGGPLIIISYGGDAAGGAVWCQNSTLQLVGCVVSSNGATGGLGYRYSVPVNNGGLAYGGAVFAATGQVWLVSCQMSGNIDLSGGNVSAFGGALYQRAGIVHIVDSLLASNTVYGGNAILMDIGGSATSGSAYGGAVCVSDGSLWITNSTLSRNLAQAGNGLYAGSEGSGFGGGVFSAGTLQIANSTVEGNTARSGLPLPNAFSRYDGNGWGGGICNSGGSASLEYVTAADNSAETIPGGISGVGSALGGAIISTNGTATLHAAILANSLSGSNGFGSLTDLGHNLSSDASCNFTGPGSLNNTDPILAPLDNYGGLTLTMALLAGSPAIDAGDPANFPPTDQRGHARPYGSAPDIGAFESSPPFTIRGMISGRTLQSEVSVTTGANTVGTTNHAYSLFGLAPNAYGVTPQSPDYLFLPASHPVTVGPDQVGVNFKAYHWNTLSLDDATNNTMHVIFAGTNGSTFRLQNSTDLMQWSTGATYTIGPANYSELFLPVNSSGSLFYRTAAP